MTALNQLANCNNCRENKHDECQWPDRCKCANYQHKDSLIIGVKVDESKEISPEFYQEIEAVNKDIDLEPDSFNNDQFDLVAETIQSNYDFITIRENRQIWCYSRSEGVYKPHGHTVVEEQAQRLVFKCKNNMIREVTETIKRSKTMIDLRELMDTKVINTQNGILDPYTFELNPHSPEYYTTTKLPFSVDMKANNLKLWQHILTIIDPKDINLIMELIWICISNYNPHKKMFIFKGLTNTQKTTLAIIITWIVGRDNISREIPTEFLGKNRFSTSKFIGKRINMASEINNITEEMLEKLKSLVGAEEQNTERKGDNTERYFDPERFVFLFTTNKLGSIYSTINDASVITRFQFLIFRNQLNEAKTNGQWYDTFFKDKKDKQSAINTVVRFVINYKKAQSTGSIPKTKWSNIIETKQILKEEQPKEDRYFEDGRLVQREGSQVLLNEVVIDFNKYVGYSDPINAQKMGYILKKNGIITNQSNSKTILKGYSFPNVPDETEKMDKYAK